MVDPDGDEIITAMLVGAAIGAIAGGATTNSWEGAWKGALIGAVGAALGAGSVALGAKIGVSGILPGSLYGGATGAISGGITGGLGSSLYGGNFWNGAGAGAKWGGLLGFASGGISGGINASKAGNNLWTGGEIGISYYSPVSNNLATSSDKAITEGLKNGKNSGCGLLCLEDISSSYNLELNSDYWYNLNGKKLGLGFNYPTLVTKSGYFNIKPLANSVKASSLDPEVVINSFRENKRVLIGYSYYNSNGALKGHMTSIRKVKIWPSGKVRYWLTQTSPDRIAPYRTSSFSQSFHNWSVTSIWPK